MQVDTEKAAKLLDAFKSFDADGSGEIDRDEFVHALTRGKGPKKFDDAAAGALFDEFAGDDKRMDYEEFVKAFAKVWENISAEEVLHREETWKQSDAELVVLITPTTAAARMAGGRGSALHLAAWFGRTVSVVEAVLKADPDAVQNRDPFLQLPLHFAVQHNASAAREEIIRLLLIAYPEALQSKNLAGRVPVDYVGICKEPKMMALLRTASTSKGLACVMASASLQATLEAAEEEMGQMGVTWDLYFPTKRELPLTQIKEERDNNESDTKLAAASGCWSLPDELLLPLLTRATAKQDGGSGLRGNKALHAAIRGGRSAAVVEKLARVYPEALQTHDNAIGDLPLHLAVSGKHQTPIEVIKSGSNC